MVHVPAIIGHRGDPFNYPENAMSGFVSCAMRVDGQPPVNGLECDFWGNRYTTMENLFLPVLHDYDLHRTTTGRGLVYELPLEEIRAAKLKLREVISEQPIPMLLDVLTLLRTQPRDFLGFLELKAPAAAGDDDRIKDGIAAFTAAALKRIDPGLARTIFMAFDHRLVTRLRFLMPEVQIGFLMEGILNLGFLATYLREFRPKWLCLYHGSVSPAVMQVARHAGCKVYVWTADTPMLWDEMSALGVDVIATNKPHECATYFARKLRAQG
jgi:glycerophosphoryl diester phosphodiesterase